MADDTLRLETRPLHGGFREADYLELESVAQWSKEQNLRQDSYGDGDDLQAFEQRIAEMLGQQSARFMPSGTMAQQIAMRVWCDREASGDALIGLHPTSHLLLHEDRGFEALHDLRAVMVGDASRAMTAADLDAVTEPLTALIIELPTRENGGQLTSWNDLVALTALARERGIAVHLDGARLWEAAAGYERPHDEIGTLFDSVYVSFYKGIEALPGSMLAGPTDFVEQATVWQNRQGGNLYTQLASWASAAMRLDPQIQKMAGYRDRAIEIAGALEGIDGIALEPSVPHVNMFHVYLQGNEDELKARRDRVAEAHDIWIFSGLQATDEADTWKFEVAVGDAAMSLDLDEIVAAFRSL